MGRFYNQSIKGRFVCRTHRVPHGLRNTSDFRAGSRKFMGQGKAPARSPSYVGEAMRPPIDAMAFG